MKAELQPLSGKYYGTIVTVTDDAGQASDLRFWHSLSTSDHPPSIREYETHWVASEESADEFRREAMSTSHYESEFALKVARLVVTAVNDLPALLAENRRLREALEIKQSQTSLSAFGLMTLERLEPRKEPE